MTHFLDWMKNTLLFINTTNLLVRLLTVNMKNCLTPKNPKMCNPILVTLMKMRPHYSQFSHENATQSGGTSPLASYKEVPPPTPGVERPNLNFLWSTPEVPCYVMLYLWLSLSQIQYTCSLFCLHFIVLFCCFKAMISLVEWLITLTGIYWLPILLRMDYKLNFRVK